MRKFLLLLFLILISISVFSSPVEWKNAVNYSFETGDYTYYDLGFYLPAGDFYWYNDGYFGAGSHVYFYIDANNYWDGSYLARAYHQTIAGKPAIYNPSFQDANNFRFYYDFNGSTALNARVICSADHEYSPCGSDYVCQGAGNDPTVVLQTYPENTSDGGDNGQAIATMYGAGADTCPDEYPYPIIIFYGVGTSTVKFDKIEYQAESVAPEIIITQPDGINDYVTKGDNNFFNVQWIAIDSDFNQTDYLTISCYIEADVNYLSYSTDNPCFTNADNNGINSCDFTDYPTDDYYIWCSATDEDAKVGLAYSSGAIKVCDIGECSGDNIVVTPISNISSYAWDFIDLYFELSDNDDDVIYHLENTNKDFSYTFNQLIRNSNLDGKQYFIYTATEFQYQTGVWVFSDTLTYGTKSNNPIQKIWNEIEGYYEHYFSKTIAQNEILYYKLSYKSPHRHYESLNISDEWFEQLEPNVLDTNTILIDEYSISPFANIRSYLYEPIPDIFGDETSAFEFQFVAWADKNSTVTVGQTINGTDYVSDTLEITTIPIRYSVTVNAISFDSQLLLKSTDNDDNSTIYFYDYAIVERGFFTKRLELLKANNNPLDVMLFGTLSKQYIQEGRSYRANTQAYDREGTFSQLQIKAIFGTTTVKTITKDLDLDAEEYFNFNELIPPIIDLNGTTSNPANPRDIIISVTIFDEFGKEVAEQSKQFKFLQYPYFPNDLRMNFYPTEKRLGKHPAGVLELQISEPDVLEGLDIRIYSDTNTVADPNYRIELYNGLDFSCSGGSCNLQITIDDYIFEDVNQTHITIFALLNTEYLDITNRLTKIDRTIYITTIDFDVAKIQQVMHRVDRIYTENEEIPVVLVLRDSEATNIYNKLDVYLIIENCNDAGGSFCVPQTTQWKPTGFIYDDKTNLNFYYFRHLYLLDNGELLPDSNYIGFHATVTDQTGITSTIIPVLADKCKDNDIDATWFLGQISSYLLGHWNPSGLIAEFSGCTTVQEAIVTTTTNNDQEVRLLIDEDHSVSSPSQELFACISPDQNNVYTEPLKQDLVCMTWYTQAEKPIDDFRIRITNQFSDLSNIDDTKQYVEFNIPYEVIASNDIISLRTQMETDSTTTIDTIGEFFFEGLRRTLRDTFFTDKLNNYSTFLLGEGLITNIGADLNFNQAFSPANITGATFYRIKGLSVINANDYRFLIGENFENIDRSQFLNYLAENNINANTQTAELELIINDFTVPLKFTDSRGSLVIDEKPIKSQINTANVNETVNYNFIPNELMFTLQNTMFFNNFSENDTRTIILRVLTQVKDTGVNTVISFINEFSEDPTGTITTFLYGSIIIIAIILALVFVISQVYRNFSGGDK